MGDIFTVSRFGGIFPQSPNTNETRVLGARVIVVESRFGGAYDCWILGPFRTAVGRGVGRHSRGLDDFSRLAPKTK